MRSYPDAEIAGQPAGYWTGVAHRAVIGHIRAALAREDLTQPHWWVLNQVAASPGTWTRATLAERLAGFADTDFTAVAGNLVDRGWLADTGTLRLTEAGEAGRARAKAHTADALDRIHAHISTTDYVTTVNVLRRMVDNLGGDSNLP
ncbi:MarR family winged helix-turn-helix transcriptional regulator [Amycolatopsis suaedae]|uniref:MarR family transcriptional regulator n=1 Tax=Amycolatopsis suaedae TaxID=2510978 RepID=A0A4Q7J3J2_9PSEU|nr:MarR family winged helix-turn-helix transcriptional regulator [Amycolatopsis suaedae]RZQ60554.1 MarR family transcriptional regulator [Amycolatopsis suaedae]